MLLMVLRASEEEKNYLRSVFRNEDKVSGKQDRVALEALVKTEYTKDYSTEGREGENFSKSIESEETTRHASAIIQITYSLKPLVSQEVDPFIFKYLKKKSEHQSILVKTFLSKAD